MTTAGTGFEYDAADHLIRTTYPDQEVVTTAYDDAGQAQELYSAERSYATSVTYDLVGRMRQRGVTREEMQRTLDEDWNARDAKAGTLGKVMVFVFDRE